MAGVVAEQPEQQRGSQTIARGNKRRRRPNGGGDLHVVKVRLSSDELATVTAAAEEAGPAGMTVPWYLVQCATNPVGAVTKDGKARAWLPWPKRQTLAAVLMSATSALDEIRLQQLAKIGSNINQITHAMHSTGALDEEELGETLAELRELMAELSERAATVEQLARDVTRR